jgi:hypothetical protein
MGSVLGIREIIPEFGGNGEKRVLNEINRVEPNMLLKTRGDLGFGEDYPH